MRFSNSLIRFGSLVCRCLVLLLDVVVGRSVGWSGRVGPTEHGAYFKLSPLKKKGRGIFAFLFGESYFSLVSDLLLMLLLPFSCRRFATTDDSMGGEGETILTGEAVLAGLKWMSLKLRVDLQEQSVERNQDDSPG